MENYGFKGLLVTLWQRVILSYKSTLVGIGIALADATIQYLTAAPIPTWAHTLVGLAAAALVLVKEPPKTPPSSAAAALVLVCVGSLGLSGCQYFKPQVKADLLSCAAVTLQTEVANALPDVVAALQGDAVDWQARLDVLIAKGGQGVICAFWALVRNLEIGSGGAGEGEAGLSPTVLLTRAYVYAADRGLARQ